MSERGNCQSLPLAESDKLFFGQGAYQKAQARIICTDCKIMDVCKAQASHRTTEQRATGVYVAEAPRTYGTFAGVTYRDGKVIG